MPLAASVTMRLWAPKDHAVGPARPRTACRNEFTEEFPSPLIIPQDIVGTLIADKQVCIRPRSEGHQPYPGQPRGLGHRGAQVQNDAPRSVQAREENRLIAAIEVGLPDVSSFAFGPVHQAVRNIESDPGRSGQV
jgi:hypothetical protein